RRTGARGRNRRARCPRGGGRGDRGGLPADGGRRHTVDGGARLLRGRDPDARPDRIRRPADDRQPTGGRCHRIAGALLQRVLPGSSVKTVTRDYSFVVGGEWAESESGARLEATSPATGESLGTVPEGTRADVQRAVAAANAAAREWAARTAFERAHAC